MNIYSRLLAVMEAVSFIKREGQAPESAGGFTYVKHDDVTAALRPHFIKNGIMVIATTESHVCDKIHGQDRQGRDRTIFFSDVGLKVSFINVEKPEDKVEVIVHGYGLDTQDKSIGKAISYAFKYALLKTLCLETGDDPEGGEPLEPPPAQRVVAPKVNGEPLGELAWLVQKWSGVQAEDVSGAVRQVLARNELPTEKSKIKPAHITKAVAWVKQQMNDGAQFEEATAIQKV